MAESENVTFFGIAGKNSALAITLKSTLEQLRHPELFEAVLEAARAGDRGSHAMLIEIAQRSIQRTVLAREGDPRLGEDAMQEAVLRCIEKLPSFRGCTAPEFRAWASAIAQNVLHETWRRRRRRDARTESFRPQAHAKAPESEQGRPRIQELRQALVEIDPRFSQVLELHYLEGLSYQEISASLGIPARTVGTRIHRGKRDLLRVLRQKADYHGS